MRPMSRQTGVSQLTADAPALPTLCNGCFSVHPTHRAVALILFYELPVVVVVEGRVGLHGLLLTQVLVLVLDTVYSSTGNLESGVGRVSEMSPVTTSAGWGGQCWTEEKSKSVLYPSFLRASLAGTL